MDMDMRHAFHSLLVGNIISVRKIDHLMLCRKIITFCSGIVQNTQMTAWAKGRFSYQLVHIVTTGLWILWTCAFYFPAVGFMINWLYHYFSLWGMMAFLVLFVVSTVRDGTRSLSYPLASRQQYLFDKCLLLYVQSWTPDDGWKDCPKHVECHSKIK